MFEFQTLKLSVRLLFIRKTLHILGPDNVSIRNSVTTIKFKFIYIQSIQLIFIVCLFEKLKYLPSLNIFIKFDNSADDGKLQFLRFFHQSSFILIADAASGFSKNSSFKCFKLK